MKQRWLLAVIVMVGLIALGAAARWWLPPLLTFAGANSAIIDGLTGLIQLGLWGGAVIVALWSWLAGRKQPPATPQPAGRYRASQKEGGLQQQGSGNTGAAGKSIAVGRDVYGDVIYVTDPAELWERLGKHRPPADLTAATNSYLRLLVDRYRYLDFRGMGVSDRIPLRLPLAEMYVPLKARIEMPDGETWSRKLQLAGRAMSEEEATTIGQRLSEPQPVLELLQKHPGLIILGDPGAGKTTFLKYLVVQLAGGNGNALGLGNRLPILLPLSAYANALADGEIALDKFIARYYRDLGVDLPLEAMLAEALQQGGALILLDGLDEVKNLAARQTVVKRVVDFFNYRQQQGNKFILTSRIVGYREVRPTCEGLAECTLVDFDTAEISDFVQKWTGALEKAARGNTTAATIAAKEEQADLLAAVERNPGVRTLAVNPLLLTILALMKRQGVTLPERRVELYDQYIKTLLKTWNLARGLGRAPSRDLDVIETVRLLAPLALWMHRTSPGVGLVKREALHRELVKICRERELPEPENAANRLLEDAREHAGLLLERGAGAYGFIHLTFQEYLAAVAIAQKGQQNVDVVVEELAAHVADDNWHEVSLLTIGHMGISQQLDAVAGEVVTRLIKQSPGQPGQAVVLAGEAVVDALPGGVDAKTCRYVQDVLTKTLTADRRVSPGLRAAAGDTLARLGDPRPEVMTVDAMQFCAVPPGLFWLGSDEEESEQPACRFEINYGYWLARYPVTVAQWREFVTASGHQPKRKESLDDPLNRPVRYVTWYEAVEFCDWLTERIANNELRGTNNELRMTNGETSANSSLVVRNSSLVCRLPSEAEWEKAARGGLHIPATPVIKTVGAGLAPAWLDLPLQSNPLPQRRYPWGNDPDPNRANYDKPGIGTTSAAGCFPQGKSVYGAEEMSGNVWEWCATKWQDNYQNYQNDNTIDRTNDRRVLRGGAFNNLTLYARCAFRGRYNPDDEDLNSGIRVVLSPFF